LINVTGFALVRCIIEINHADNEYGGNGAGNGTDHPSIYLLLEKVTQKLLLEKVTQKLLLEKVTQKYFWEK
jgi:hypothetical protein